MKEKILNAVSSPKELEMLYQENPEEFRKEFFEIFSQYPDSLILQTWNERLSYKNELQSNITNQILSAKNFIVLAVLVLIGGTIFNFYINAENYRVTGWFFNRIFSSILIVLLMIYFSFQKENSWRIIALISAITVATLIYIYFLPNQYAWDYDYARKYGTFSDALTTAELHIPLFLWLVLGVSFLGNDWWIISKWIQFLRYNGEFLIYLTLISISVFVLSGITFLLLGIIETRSELTEWYSENIIMYEVAAAPLIATFLIDKITGNRLRIAPILAKVFAPLFLITTIAYLIVITTYQKNPFTDRETLVILNFLMLLVLGMSIFSIAERNPNQKSGFYDYINIGLITTTATINIIALTAVVLRLTSDEYGFTPNRIIILGINLLVFIHLMGILVHYSRFILNKAPYEKIEEWVTKYLLVYAVWAIAISIILPVLFWYK